MGQIGRIGPMGPIGQMGPMGLMGPIGLIRPIVLALMLVLLTACGGGGSDSVGGGEVVTPPPVNPEQGGGDTPYSAGPAMSFSAAFADQEVQKPASSPASRRAVGDGEFTTDSLQRLGFGVFCWYTRSSDHNGSNLKSITKEILMLNQKVEYKNGLWTYSPTKYWPLDASEKLTFRAYAPYVSYQLQMNETTGLPWLPVAVTATDYRNGTQHDPLWGTGKLVNGSEYNPLPDRSTFATDEDFEEAVKAYYRYGTLYDNITYKMSGDWRDKPTDHDPADTRDGTIDWYFHHGMAKLMFACSVIKDSGCDRVIIRSIKIESLYNQGLLSLSSPTTSENTKPEWAQKAGDMTVTLEEATPVNTEPGDLAPTPGAAEGHEYPFVITTSTTQATDYVNLLSHGLLIIPRDFTSPNQPMKVTISYSIDDDEEVLTATGNIPQNFRGNTSYTARLSLTPSTRGLEISLVQSAFAKWETTVEGGHDVYNW